MKTGRRITIIIILVALLLVFFQLTRLDRLIQVSQTGAVMASPFENHGYADLKAEELSLYERTRVLVISKDDPEVLANLAATLDTLNCEADFIDASTREAKLPAIAIKANLHHAAKITEPEAAVQQASSDAETVTDYEDYDLIILTHMKQEDLVDREALFAYARLGGNLIYLGNGSIGPEDLLISDAAFWGIEQAGAIKKTHAVYFNTELLTGVTGAIEITGEFVAPFDFFHGSDVSLVDGCLIHMESGEGNPLIWQKQVVNGRIMVLNVGQYDRKELRGLLAGSISVLFDFFVYPVVGSQVVFIDDFPADYRSTHEILRTNYGRDLQRYILEIWWPQMQVLMRRHNLKLTGTYIETYSDQVEGPFADNTATRVASMKLVSDLLAGGGEMSLHGYNHQPLFFSQTSMQPYNYKAWPNADQMVAALQQSVAFFEQIYAGYVFYTYSAPSELLDTAALPALLAAVPSLQVISGTYYGNGTSAVGDQADLFIQEFGLDERYGVALPKVTSGAFLTDEVRFLMASVLTTDGLINHLVYPDEILDPYRSKSLLWEDLVDAYDQLFSDIDETYGWLLPETAANAAARLERTEQATLHVSQATDQITLACDHFSGPITAMVTTDRVLAAGSGCTIKKIDSIRYLVSIQEPISFLEVMQP